MPCSTHACHAHVHAGGHPRGRPQEGWLHMHAMRMCMQVATPAADLKKAGLSATELRVGKYKAVQLLEAGFSVTDLRTGGYTAAQLRAAGQGADALKAGGYSAGAHMHTCMHARMHTCVPCMHACMHADALKTGGYSTVEGAWRRLLDIGAQAGRCTPTHHTCDTYTYMHIRR